MRPGAVCFYKTYDKLGNVVREDKRTITRVFKNEKGLPLIEWEGKRDSGVCMEATWLEWFKGVDESKRRGLTVWES